MSYNVFLHPAVVKFLRKLPKDDVERIKSKLAEVYRSILCQSR